MREAAIREAQWATAAARSLSERAPVASGGLVAHGWRAWHAMYAVHGYTLSHPMHMDRQGSGPGTFWPRHTGRYSTLTGGGKRQLS